MTDNFFFKVTDNGGLSGYGTANVTVIDENDPPVCLRSQEILNAEVSRYASVGTIVTSLMCWDYDIEPDYSTIVYTIIDNSEGIHIYSICFPVYKMAF